MKKFNVHAVSEGATLNQRHERVARNQSRALVVYTSSTHIGMECLAGPVRSEKD